MTLVGAARQVFGNSRLP